MLDEYKDSQPIVYKILKNAVSKDKYSHAYLIETNGFSDSLNLALAFIKTIMCPNKYFNNEKCQNCHQCKVIDSGNFPEIEIIKPDGMWIKKNQVQELQEEFSKKAIIGNKKIYIIANAEKLKTEAANSILKFLEEPAPGIIAILLTENLYQVIETIRSRCQILNLKNLNSFSNSTTTIEKLNQIYYSNLEIQDTKEQIEKILNFVSKYENNRINTILYTTSQWHQFIKSKEDYEKAFEIIILYYKDILNQLTNRNLEYFSDYQQGIRTIAEKNTIQTICNKLNILTDFKERIKYNANTNLLMDKLIIDLEGGVK